MLFKGESHKTQRCKKTEKFRTVKVVIAYNCNWNLKCSDGSSKESTWRELFKLSQSSVQ